MERVAREVRRGSLEALAILQRLARGVLFETQPDGRRRRVRVSHTTRLRAASALLALAGAKDAAVGPTGDAPKIVVIHRRPAPRSWEEDVETGGPHVGPAELLGALSAAAEPADAPIDDDPATDTVEPATVEHEAAEFVRSASDDEAPTVCDEGPTTPPVPAVTAELRERLPERCPRCRDSGALWRTRQGAHVISKCTECGWSRATPIAPPAEKEPTT
jgi:hypothetical protein